MPDIPTHNLEPHRRGDTWTLPMFAFPESVDLSGKIARIEWRRRPSRDSELGDSISSDGTEAVLSVDAVAREITCAPHVPALGKGTWYGDLQLVDPTALDPRGEPHTRTYANLVATILDDRTV